MSSTLQFSRIPGTLPLFAKLAVAKGKADKTLAQPLRAEVQGVVATRTAIQKYVAVCGGHAGLSVPILYPQVLGTPLTMSLMTHADFPLAALGLVHVENEVTQERAPRVGEKLGFVVEIPAIERTPRGYEFDMLTQVREESGVLIWHSRARILSRAKHDDLPAPPSPPRQAPEPSAWPLLDTYSLASNLGRRYARVSGDYNPIHLTALTARTLGFSRAIIHGMWSAAAVAASLDVSEGPCRFGCEFKTPLYLPGKGNLHAQSRDGGVDFILQDARSFKPILAGRYGAG